MPELMNEVGWTSNHLHVIYSDDRSANKWASKQETNLMCAKNIDVLVHFVKQLVSDGQLQTTHIFSEENDADLIKKPLK